MSNQANCVGDRNFVDIAPLALRKEIPWVHEWSGRTFLGREGDDEFFEPWITAERVPLGVKT